MVVQLSNCRERAWGHVCSHPASQAPGEGRPDANVKKWKLPGEGPAWQSQFEDLSLTAPFLPALLPKCFRDSAPQATPFLRPWERALNSKPPGHLVRVKGPETAGKGLGCVRKRWSQEKRKEGEKQ